MAKNYAVEAITSMPFGHIIGAPLTAAIDAQAAAARSTLDFILDVGFLPAAADLDKDPFYADDEETPNRNSDLGTARYITFDYTTTPRDPAAERLAAETAAKAAGANAAKITAAGDKAFADAQSNSASLTVPLLTIVPIPYLAIEEMTIDFVAKLTETVTSSRKKVSTKNKKGSGGARVGFGPFSFGAKGSYSSKHSSSASRTSKYQTELTMNVNVRATSEDMPAGLAKVLEILASSVVERRAA